MLGRLLSSVDRKLCKARCGLFGRDVIPGRSKNVSLYHYYVENDSGIHLESCSLDS
jgi:hypothetical protein